MDNLVPKSPCGDLLPMTVGSVSVREVDLGQMALILPFKKKVAEVSKRLKQDIGLTLPKANSSVVHDVARLLWFGRDSYMLVGRQDCELLDCAAVTDQSDAWACVEVSGEGVEDVLARLVPVDLRPFAFGPDATIQTLVGHMTASLTRVGPDEILIMVFRSMAETLVEDLKEAMEAVAARR